MTKVVEVTLSDSTKIMVKEPRDLARFLGAMPSLLALQKLFEAADSAEKGVFITTPVQPEVIEGLYPLLAEMCDMSLDDFKELGVFDKFGILQALTMFIPKSVTNSGN